VAQVFDQSDPRSKLMINSSEGGHHLQYKIERVKHVRFYEETPTLSRTDTKSWWSRGQNFYLHFTDSAAGEVLKRTEQADEYVVILLDKSTTAKVTWNEQELNIEGYSVIFIPSGNSELEIINGGRVIRLFTILNHDLSDLPINREDYKIPDRNAAPFESWPESPKGTKLRAYRLDIPQEEGRFGRIFRCSTFMLSFLYPWEGPRDPKKMSPHAHDDFEQCSFCFSGEFVHHFRWPWGINKERWLPDQHDYCASPSVTMIPPGVIHTTEAVGSGTNELVDIFCPPRIDFSKQAGWVLNEEDYPFEQSTPPSENLVTNNEGEN
jgi:hypothetical protein